MARNHAQYLRDLRTADIQDREGFCRARACTRRRHGLPTGESCMVFRDSQTETYCPGIGTRRGSFSLADKPDRITQDIGNEYVA
jgi:hypothetical protein